MKTPLRRPYPSPKRQRELFKRIYPDGWEVWGHEYGGGFRLYRNRVFVGLFINCPDIHEAHRRALTYLVNRENETLDAPDRFGRTMHGRIRLDI